jgi:hypothetical protein
VSQRRGNLVWIASYPKSGNTWVRFLACNLLYGRQESASTLNDFAPDVHEMAPRMASSAYAGLAKTHFVFSSRMPFADSTAAAIYVVREPADVLVSNFHYAQRSGNGSADPAAFDRYVDAFLASRGDPRWIGLGMGSWEENVCSWLGTSHPFPVLAMKYEDLAAEPDSSCQALARLLRPASTAEEMRQAVANSSFERMRQIEEADIQAKRLGIFYKPYLQPALDSGRRFMRNGRVGDGAACLRPEQRAAVHSVFGPLRRQLGYASA